MQNWVLERLLVTKMINKSYNGVEIGKFYKRLCIYFYPAGSAFSDEPDQCYYWCTKFSNHLRVPNFEENIVFSLRYNEPKVPQFDFR